MCVASVYSNIRTIVDDDSNHMADAIEFGCCFPLTATENIFPAAKDPLYKHNERLCTRVYATCELLKLGNCLPSTTIQLPAAVTSEFYMYFVSSAEWRRAQPT